MIYKTLVLKLHKPSQTKAQTIDAAMLKYGAALEYLLEEMDKKLKKSPQPYANGKMLVDIDKTIMNGLADYAVEPFKDALRQDAKNILTGYLARKNHGIDCPFPKVYLPEKTADKLLTEQLLAYENQEINKKQCQKEINHILAKKEKAQTIFFCRHETNRDFAILYNPHTNRYYAKVYLLNYKHSLPNKNQGYSALVYLNQGKTPFVSKQKKVRYIILPLSFGKWQEQYLQMVYANKMAIKTARLLKKNQDYYLFINLQFNKITNQKQDTYLGILPINTNSLKYALANSKKEILQIGELQSQAHTLAEITRDLAGQTVALAKKENAQTVFYNPKTKGVLTKLAINWQIPLGEYESVVAKIYQKFGEQELPPPIQISPRGLYTTCPKCGNNTKANLCSQQLFICNKCGYSNQPNQLGAINTAIRLINYVEKPLSFKFKKTETEINIYNQVLSVNLTIPYNAKCLDQFIAYLEQEKAYGKKIFAGKAKYTQPDLKQKYLLWHKLQSLNNFEQIKITENKIIVNSNN